MSMFPTVQVNQHEGFYERGKSFANSKWVSIVTLYLDELRNTGDCTVRALAKKASVSISTADKAIRLANQGLLVPPVVPKGHGRKGAGSLIGLNKEHFQYLYALYQNNPALPLYGYCEELERKFGITVSEQVILRWYLILVVSTKVLCV